MTINIQTAADISEYTRQLINEKLGKLETYYDRIERADVYIKEGDGTGINNQVLEVRLAVPGPDLFAEDSNETLEKALANVTDKLSRQVRKFKEKMSNH